MQLQTDRQKDTQPLYISRRLRLTRNVMIITGRIVTSSFLPVMLAELVTEVEHKVQKFSSGTGSPGWSQKKGNKTVACVWYMLVFCCIWFSFVFWCDAFRVLWRCWLGGRKGIRPVKTERWDTGVVICLERGANYLHMVLLMPLPPHHLLIQ